LKLHIILYTDSKVISLSEFCLRFYIHTDVSFLLKSLPGNIEDEDIL